MVTDQHKQVLLIHRRGKWDLPKGKLDPNESIDECALRKVEEKTGLKQVKLVEPLTATYHVYDESGRHILKETHWYLMNADSKQAFVPQADEQIDQIVWVKESGLIDYFNKTYPLIIDVLAEAGLTKQLQ